MTRRRGSKVSAAGVKDGQRVFDALDLAIMRELLATPIDEGLVHIRPPPPRSDDWFVRQATRRTPAATMLPDADQSYVDLVRWRAVQQAHNAGLSWPKAYLDASVALEPYGRPFAGKWPTMKYSNDAIQRLRRGLKK
jgi:hypothetical protein